MSDRPSRLQQIMERSREALARLFQLRQRRDRIIADLDRRLDEKQAERVRNRLKH